MKTLQMNTDLLNVLVALKQKQSLTISESILGLEIDWPKTFGDYFYNLPDELINKVGLIKNEYCLKQIQSFTIPQEWYKAEAIELGNYEFSF